MLLTVSKKVGMWGFGPLWFTFADPEPQEVDFTELDEETRDKVNLAISQGVLLQIDNNGKQVSIPVIKKEKQVVQRSIVDETFDTQVSIQPMVARKIKQLLKNGVTTLRKEIPLLKGHSVLRAALQIEKENKSRKTVIAMLEKAIENTGSLKMYDDLIVEEEGEEVKFELSDIILEHKSKIIEARSEDDLKEQVQKL